MKNNNLSKFFSSGIQAIGFQVLGVFFYYYISLYFSKENFGLISWSNAFCMFLTSILSCGMEQIVGRRIAVSKTSDWAAVAYLLHSFIGSLLVFFLLIILHFLFKNSINLYYLPFFFVAQSLVYIASPLKQFLNSKEKFSPYAVIVIISNIGKISFAYYFIIKHTLSVSGIIVIQIFFATFEIISLIIYVYYSSEFDLKLRLKFNAYKKLLKESVPQYFAVIFDSSLARMDWILLGILSTSVATADYSFAYRAYEITKLPISVLAPVILPRFARMMMQNTKFDTSKKYFLENIYIVEIFFAIILVLCLDILWEPTITYITHGKYGVANASAFYILSFCIPMQFFINLLWSLCFASKKYRSISTLITFSAAINIVLNLILIPIFQGVGAATSFFITCIIQSIGYYKIVKRDILSLPVKNLISFYLIGIIAYFISYFTSSNALVRLIVAMSVYLLLCISLRQISRKHLSSIVQLLKR